MIVYDEVRDRHMLECPTEPCYACHGTGWVPRDPGIGTDQECFCCGGSGYVEAE